MSLLFKSSAHLFCTAKSESLSDAKKPTEAKNPGHIPTVRVQAGRTEGSPVPVPHRLVSDRDVQGQRLINTVKDRERMEVVDRS